MNEDRELLELAALAAGVKYDDEKSKPKDGHAWWGLWLKFDREPSEYDRRYWNPLADDGDALRLAVIVGSKMFKGNGVALLFADNEDKAVVFRDFENIRAVENATNDPLAATRRAVVRGAAEIGKKVKEQDK